MDLEATWSEIQTLPSLIAKINARERESVSILYNLYKKVFKERVNINCSNCHIKAFQKLTSLTFENLENMSDQKFKLKKGIVLDPEADGTHYTNANLTDEIAASILKKNPKLSVHFESLPKAEKAQEVKKEETKKVEPKSEVKSEDKK